MHQPNAAARSRLAPLLVALAAGLLVLVAASAAYAYPSSGSFALARILNANGETVGAALLTQQGEEVRVFAWARGLTPGKHGIHLHAVGSCVPPAFASAGSHFNPEGKKHGLHNPEGAHGGDLPNMETRENGLGILRAETDRATLGEGSGSLLDADGSAVVIHAAEDDQVTDPTGNSGARIACGVIQHAQ